MRVASGGGGRDGAGAEHGGALQEMRRGPGHVVLSAPGHVVGHVIAPCHVVGHVIGPGHVVLATPAHLFSGGGENVLVEKVMLGVTKQINTNKFFKNFHALFYFPPVPFLWSI